MPPSAGIIMNVSSETLAPPVVVAMRTSRRLVERLAAASRAVFSSETTVMVSPAEGTSLRPMISTGTEGPAFFVCLPLSSMSARILP